MKKSYNHLKSGVPDSSDSRSLTVFSELIDLPGGHIILEVTSSNDSYHLKIEKSRKISIQLKISLYINDCIMNTFILDNDISVDLSSMPSGRYRVNLGKYRSFQFTLSR
ncbi:MAG: hypothetical protein OEZ34_01025 [Spirochaetia bacterium]|nr:hypothetical protein [Spirochaetia bacterium]